MPKTPILQRTAYLETLKDGSVRMLDWNAVETELGTMVEPRQNHLDTQLPMAGNVGFAAVDVYDMSFTRIIGTDSNTFYTQYGTDGQQVPIDFSR